jgi:nucleoside-diphosphate-sugar epimerase
VLGSEGIIGNALSKHLESINHEVIRWDIKLSHEHDISNPTNMRKLKYVIENSDFVFFLAYDVGGAKYISNAGIDFINRNVMIMLNTFNLLENKKFVFASSTMYNMHNVYGTLKYLGEHYTTQLGGLSTRFWNVYGHEESNEKSHVIADMIYKWKKNGYIDLMTSGEEERQFLHTDDCSKALVQINQTNIYLT